MPKINVVGLGYIGLPTALIMQKFGLIIVGTDNNIEVLKKLKAGKATFDEVGLQGLFNEAISKGLEFSATCIEAQYYLIAVPTPYDKVSKKIDVIYLQNAMIDVLKACPEEAIIIIESTISPGTIEKYIRPLIVDKNVHLVHAPERILPGNMIYELENNSRTIGADSKEVGEKVRLLYQSFCKADIYVTDIKTAEMSKIVENTYRDINIAYANELAKICRSDNMDVYEIISVANKHPRVNILQPGPGVGGHCISVDPWFLVGDYPGLANIILAARKINDSMPEFVLERVACIMKECNIKDISKVGFYGLTYKENVDDVRESPTLQLIECMRKHLAFGARFYDPYTKQNIVENQFFELEQFIDNVEIIVIMVSHQEILDKKDLLQTKIILDTRNVIKGENVYHL
jgi:UDP-N-acetyl-D-mannosaminuronic acid dehydrogenase